MARPDYLKGDSMATKVGGAPVNPYKEHDIDCSWKSAGAHVVESRNNKFSEKKVGK